MSPEIKDGICEIGCFKMFINAKLVNAVLASSKLVSDEIKKTENEKKAT